MYMSVLGYFGFGLVNKKGVSLKLLIEHLSMFNMYKVVKALNFMFELFLKSI